VSTPNRDSTRIAARAAAVAPFHVMRILARARELEAQGRRILHLEVGEPDFPTPQPVVEAAFRALAEGCDHYTPAAGLPDLRTDLAGYYASRYGVSVDPDRILVTPGASGALQLALLALAGPGDRVMIGDPSYPCYRQVISLTGAEPLLVATDSQTGYRLTPALAEAAWAPEVRAVLIASPANPTGVVLSLAELGALYELCRARGVVLIVDEIYQGLVYDAVDCTALALGEPGLFVVNSFSKYFGMTGWRVGWIVAPRNAAAIFERLAQNLFIAAGTVAQHAARAALSDETLSLLEERRCLLRARRDILLTDLRKLGFSVGGCPEGAFYLYARLPISIGIDSMELASRLLEDAGVAVTPGADFGERNADRHLRLAYVLGIDQLSEALGRLGRVCSGLGGSA
jgi:aspartate/methionine/tyrosine aminotransferase